MTCHFDLFLETPLYLDPCDLFELYLVLNFLIEGFSTTWESSKLSRILTKVHLCCSKKAVHTLSATSSPSFLTDFELFSLTKITLRLTPNLRTLTLEDSCSYPQLLHFYFLMIKDRLLSELQQRI